MTPWIETGDSGRPARQTPCRGAQYLAIDEVFLVLLHSIPERLARGRIRCPPDGALCECI